MEHFKGLRRGRTLFGFVCVLISKTVLSFLDILCVGTCFWTILCLLYATLLKDYFEVLIYATLKCTYRLKWLYRILKIKKLLYLSTCETPESTAAHNSSYPVQLIEIQPNNSCKPIKFHFNQTKRSLNSDEEARDELSACFQSSPSRNAAQYAEQSASRYNISSQSNQIVTSSENLLDETNSFNIIDETNSFNIIDETNFENVDLTPDAKAETDPDSGTSPKEKFSVKLSSLSWNVNKMKFFNSFRKSKLPSHKNLKSKLENVTSKVSEVLPDRADEEKLMTKSDSPEKVGCCTSLPYLFRAKFQMSPIVFNSVQYEQF